nr:RecName: Full=Uncharacterized protein SMPP13 [Nautilus macromphalus]
TSTVFSDGQR